MNDDSSVLPPHRTIQPGHEGDRVGLYVGSRQRAGKRHERGLHTALHPVTIERERADERYAHGGVWLGTGDERLRTAPSLLRTRGSLVQDARVFLST
jgi:hypothetical protein